MEIQEAILTRRSIRRYTDQQLTDDQIRVLLDAAMHAPSAGNHQPWHFVVIDDRDTMVAVTKLHPNAGMLEQANRAILVCGDTEKEMAPGYWVQDTSAALQNILLAAHGLGLGAVWLGVHPREERIAAVRNLFGLPSHVAPLGFVSLGYPAEEKSPSQRFDPERVHTNRW